MKEAQKQLYQWRQEFFHKNFKSVFFGDDKKAANWITFGFDDSHILDTVPYQITQNFEEVLKLASTKKLLDPNQYERFYFKNDQTLSYEAMVKFDPNCDEEWDKVLQTYWKQFYFKNDEMLSNKAVLSFEFDGDENGPTYELNCAPMGQ